MVFVHAANVLCCVCVCVCVCGGGRLVCFFFVVLRAQREFDSFVAGLWFCSTFMLGRRIKGSKDVTDSSGMCCVGVRFCCACRVAWWGMFCIGVCVYTESVAGDRGGGLWEWQACVCVCVAWF
jgi:hypothetical protein